MKLSTVTVAQIGARRHYAIPTLLEREGMLSRLYTDLCANVWWLQALQKVVPDSLRAAPLRRLLSRYVADVPVDKIHTFPLLAFRRIYSRHQTNDQGATLRHYARMNERFGHVVVRSGLGSSSIAYTFNGAGLEILRHANRQGLKGIVEQTAAPRQLNEELLNEERERWPGWETSSVSESDWRPLSNREIQEWQQADLVICGSDYVAQGVRQLSSDARCVVVPYGIDSEFFSPAVRKASSKRPLRVVLVGTVQLRKGVQYLMEAAKLLKDEEIQITVVGPIAVEEKAQHELRQHLTLTGPIPRANIAQVYAEADVLALPTLSEGSAGVCYEALAAGLPVITTPNAGSVIRDEKEGFIVPIRDAEALADRISLLASDTELRQQLAAQAAKRASEYTWSDYQKRIRHAIDVIL